MSSSVIFSRYSQSVSDLVLENLSIILISLSDKNNTDRLRVYRRSDNLLESKAPHTRLGNRGYIKPLVTGGTTAGVCLSTAIYVPDWHKHDLLPAVVVHGKSCIRRILRMPRRTGLQKPVWTTEVKKSKCLSECLYHRILMPNCYWLVSSDRIRLVNKTSIL